MTHSSRGRPKYTDTSIEGWRIGIANKGKRFIKLTVVNADGHDRSLLIPRDLSYQVSDLIVAEAERRERGGL